jgi:hypothetical protein
MRFIVIFATQIMSICGLYFNINIYNVLFKFGLTNDPICERCLEEDESATHVLRDCEAVAHIRFRHLGQFFMEPSDFYDGPIDKVLHFIRGVRINNRLIKK